jgi:5-methylcytosine-specific restriction enzyme subunit McrC
MTSRADRTLFLTERARRVCRLAPADAAFLAAHHAAHFELLPTGRRDVYALRPGGFVGVVTAPTRRLVVRPKIPLANLFFLLDSAAPYPAASDSSAPDDGREALDFLAGQLARRLRERADAGLHRGYAERETAGPFLLGRLDAAAQMRGAAARKEQLHCRHDAFTADVLCNRAARSAAELARTSPLLRDETRAALDAALRDFAEVTAVALTPDVWAALDAGAPEAYRPLLDLGRLLADALAPGETGGPTPGPAFLLNLEQVFERFLTRTLSRAAETSPSRGRWRVEAQPTLRAASSAAGQPDLNIRPDVLLLFDEMARLIVDAKWKRLGATPLVAADVYQVLAYCSALGVGRGVLVYPGRRDRAWRYDLERGGGCLLIRTLRVVGEREALARSARRLGRRLLRDAVRAGN